MRFELTVGVDPLQRFSKPLHIAKEMAIVLESIDESERELREHDTNTHMALTQEVTQETGADPASEAPVRRRYRAQKPKTATSLKRMPSALAGRAGTALVEFQLGRRGFEFIRTPTDSKSGDLWAETGIGRVSIEVKATVRGSSWFVKVHQMGSEIFCLTSLDEAICYVLTRAEMQAAIAQSAMAYPGVYCVHFRSLPSDSLEGWHRLGGLRMRAIEKEARRAIYKSTRIVRQKMADGTIKEYRYPGLKEKAAKAA